MLNWRAVLLAALLGVSIWGFGVVEMRLEFITVFSDSILVDVCTDGSRLYVVEITPLASVVHVRSFVGDRLGEVFVNETVYACAADGNRLVLVTAERAYVYNKTLKIEKIVDLPKIGGWYLDFRNEIYVDKDSRYLYIAWRDGDGAVFQIRRISDLALVYAARFSDNVWWVKATPSGVMISHGTTITVVTENTVKNYNFNFHFIEYSIPLIYYLKNKLYILNGSTLVIISDNKTREVELGGFPWWITSDGEGSILVLMSYDGRNKLLLLDSEGRQVGNFTFYVIPRNRYYVDIYTNNTHLILMYKDVSDYKTIYVVVVRKGLYRPARLTVCYLSITSLLSLVLHIFINNQELYNEKKPCLYFDGMVPGRYDITVVNTYALFAIFETIRSEATLFLPPGGDATVVLSDMETGVMIGAAAFLLMRRLGLV
ncbi:hypothetical protein [Pyrobaculum aerophilum]|uniref:Uncharacterized protein n=2 Tax=Pyrobaculum aerophilum TaxID=13773 RepID=Q8ZZG2_PYRAE|nr:hypothetical protein [Pyrobaculum aerophilum]AAL62679.1 hypothetical protein PAE0279 [Pyrobaculum aerophilum str. IM2]MCX8137187.1 hypothetical protein [Pyrobaculum aerophilum]HII46731.1 hypothetical protein [Pyrobaculum aerophilum]